MFKLKRRKTYNKYDKSKEEVNTEPKVLTDEEKKRRENLKKVLEQQLNIMKMVGPYGRF